MPIWINLLPCPAWQKTTLFIAYIFEQEHKTIFTVRNMYVVVGRLQPALHPQLQSFEVSKSCQLTDT